MTIKQGGYATGHTYRWYREMGHGPISATWMLIPMWLAFFIAILGGCAIGMVIR